MLQALRVRQARRAETTLLTPPFVAVALAALAYFTGDGILIAALPRYVAGPLGGGNIAVGVVVGAFSVSAFILRPWAGGFGDRRGRKPLMLAGAALFAVSVLGYGLTSEPVALTAVRNESLGPRFRHAQHQQQGEQPRAGGEQPCRTEPQPLDSELAEERAGADADVQRQRREAHGLPAPLGRREVGERRDGAHEEECLPGTCHESQYRQCRRITR